MRMRAHAAQWWRQAISALLLAAGTAATCAAQNAALQGAQNTHIYTWVGNTAAWDRKLHVAGYRMGCDLGDPDGCVRQATEVAQQNGLTTVFLSLFEDPAHTVADARECSRLSLTHPLLTEVGFDDFVGRYWRLFSRPRFDPPTWLRDVIHGARQSNAKMGFGITLYEDDLDSPYLRAPKLPADVAQSIDFVHLYLHYRTDAPQLPAYVVQTKALFPNAKIIVGLYAYDRIDYIPCAADSHRPCAQEEEIHLYKDALTRAAQMLKDGGIAGIEFYPGFFGKETEWSGWKNAEYCAPARIDACLKNTLAMRESTAEILRTELGW
jgi:hypothetical protein